VEIPDGELHLLERLLTLEASRPFERAGMQPLLRLARAATERRLAEGETLVREGDAAGHCFVVVSGTVTLERADLAAPFGPAALVGAYAGFGQALWPGTVRALGAARVLAIRYDDLYDVMEDHFDLVRSVMAFLALERERLQLASPPRE
jgi:CRP-like cAMP-binding protein